MRTNHPVHFLDYRYEQIQRSRQIIARLLELNNQEYRLWDLICTLRPMPYKEIRTTDIICATNLQISQILGEGWSESTVSRHRNSLAAKKVIEQLTESSSRILIGLEKEIPTILQEEVAKLKESIANLQVPPEKKTTISNNSNKSSNLLTPIQGISLPDTVRTLAEYEQIRLEGNYLYLTAEDMIWIDSQHYN